MYSVPNASGENWNFFPKMATHDQEIQEIQVQSDSDEAETKAAMIFAIIFLIIALSMVAAVAYWIIRAKRFGICLNYLLYVNI